MGAGPGVFFAQQQRDLSTQLDATNAQNARTAADDAITRGSLAAGVARMKGSQLAAEQQVGYATSGIDVGVGTPAQTIAQTRMMSELDAQTLKNNAAREAWGFATKAVEYQEQQGLDEDRGTEQMFSSILGGVSGAVSAYSAVKGSK
jgi:hypothetical protein